MRELEQEEAAAVLQAHQPWEGLNAACAQPFVASLAAPGTLQAPPRGSVSRKLLARSLEKPTRPLCSQASEWHCSPLEPHIATATLRLPPVITLTTNYSSKQRAPLGRRPSPPPPHISVEPHSATAILRLPPVITLTRPLLPIIQVHKGEHSLHHLIGRLITATTVSNRRTTCREVRWKEEILQENKTCVGHVLNPWQPPHNRDCPPLPPQIQC